MKNVHGWNAAYRAAAGMSTSSTASHLQVSAVERLHVSFAEHMDDKFFKCVSCGKDFSKRSAFKHFTRKRHGLDANAVKGWLGVRWHRPAEREAPQNEIDGSLVDIEPELRCSRLRRGDSRNRGKSSDSKVVAKTS